MSKGETLKEKFLLFADYGCLVNDQISQYERPEGQPQCFLVRKSKHFFSGGKTDLKIVGVVCFTDDHNSSLHLCTSFMQLNVLLLEHVQMALQQQLPDLLP